MKSQIHIADHPEGQEVTGIYSRSCRICTRTKDKTGQWILRNKHDAISHFQEMMNEYNTPGHRTTAYKKSKEYQQHIYPLPQWNLNLHYPYISAPMDPGHSEDQGLFMKHLYWTLRKWTRTNEDKEKNLPKLDPNHERRDTFDERIRQFSNYSGIRHWTYQSICSFAKKKNPTKLTAFDYQSIRCIVLFAFCGLIDKNQLDLWKLHVLYASAFQKKNWSEKDLQRLERTIALLMQGLNKQFPEQMAKASPKLHDPNHLLFFIQLFGDTDNFTAMLMESVHKYAKGEAPNTNHQTVLEEVLMERVSK